VSGASASNQLSCVMVNLRLSDGRPNRAAISADVKIMINGRRILNSIIFLKR